MKKIVLAITGASGGIYPKIFLDFMRAQQAVPLQELFVVASPNGERVFAEENGITLREFWPELISPKTFDVPFVSGSALADGYEAMVILPCSMGTLGRIAHGLSDDTITRTADVFLKERKKLIVVARETPLSLIHLRNMVSLTEAGAMILPAIPSFYGQQKTLADVASTVVARVLDQLQIDNDLMKRWK